MATLTKPAYIAAASQGRILNELGHTAVEKVVSADSGGSYYVFTVVSPPGLGIPPHIHSREDEVIYIAEGEYDIFLDGQIHRAMAGDVLNFARGTAHGFTNAGTTAGKTVWFVTPGEAFEAFFHDLATVPAGPPDIAMIAGIFGQYGMELLPPPGL